MTLIDRAVQRLETLLDGAAMLALIVMMLLTVADAGGRYLFASPVTGAYEITEFYLMIAVVFFGLAGTERTNGHVRVDLVLAMMPRRLRLGLDTLYLLAAAVLFGLIAWKAGDTAWMNLKANRWTGGAMPLPTAPSWAIVSLGAGVLSLRLVLRACLLIPAIIADQPQPAATDAAPADADPARTGPAIPHPARQGR
ncbi:TRAP transporter small permease [Tistrella sp. BH-R2-4]|uniref:TRAP transporter small permease protein n=1 Tax=Tistrella arctica TaxID=3133430 RepID=A0ABU9YNQ3_9PROT